MSTEFPAGFLWGAATSGYQIEGGARADGKGASIWDSFVRRPGAILHGDSGELACNAYDRRQLDADLDLMAALGLGLYVFSVQWPRLQPNGRGHLRQKGLDYYRHLVDGLLARGIVPALTLYHWELPQALQDGGGWRKRETALRFADYAGLVHHELADKVPLWITQNEPWTTAWMGHVLGSHAPGEKDEAQVFAVVHHLLLSHGLAVQSMRASVAGAETRFGPVLNLSPYRPADPHSARDRAAATRGDGEQNRLFLEPLFKGRYPQDVSRRLTRRAGGRSFIEEGDMAAIATPLDFLGINYYMPVTVAAGRGGRPEPVPPTGPKTAMDWPIDAPGLFEVLQRVQRDYSGELPLLVSENGISCRDYVDPAGVCNDAERIEFLRDHIEQAARAVAAGVPLKGYCVWSLLDNFEWDSGYRERFGLVHVDYPTQTRTPKASFDWYRKVIATNGPP